MEEETVAVADRVVVAEAVEIEEETGKDVLALMIPEEIANTKAYDGPPRREEEEIAMEEAKEAEVALEKVVGEAQPEVAEEKKKKKKNKGKKVGEVESSHHRKEKMNKEKKDDDENEEARKERKKKEKEEKKMRWCEERRLRKEEEAR
ncbi:protein PXR1-like [Benincasa hispida]|uniref:protein PXR1-like n=1 Tax=Benincasa hispida TaxID=102211 RepID=UPI0018FF9D43|nr:protein PXR1-like [Benincasa hispida]